MGKLQTNQLTGMNLHYGHYTLEYFLDRAVENGLEQVELWAASPHYHIDDATPEQTKRVRQAIAARGLKLVCLTPETVVYPVNIAAPEPYLRERSVQMLLKALECASGLECGLMLVTPGWGYLDQPREEALQRSLASLERIVQRAGALGITIGFEHLSPISSNLVNTAAQVKQVLDAINSPNLKALVDTCQVCLGGEHLRDYFELLDGRIAHIHMVDGTPGGHLAFGDGTIPLEEFTGVMAEYGYSGYLSMEISDRRYFSEPQKADIQSIQLFQSWIGKMQQAH